MDHVDPHQYTISIKRVALDEGAFFEALVAELPDVVEYADTYEEAYALALESIADLNVAAKEQARDFPAPLPSRTLEEHSGRVTLRMSKRLHMAASKLADRDGISLNSWVSEAIAIRVGACNPNQATPYIAAKNEIYLAMLKDWIHKSYPSDVLLETWFTHDRGEKSWAPLSRIDTTKSFVLYTN